VTLEQLLARQKTLGALDDHLRRSRELIEDLVNADLIEIERLRGIRDAVTKHARREQTKLQLVDENLRED